VELLELLELWNSWNYWNSVPPVPNSCFRVELNNYCINKKLYVVVPPVPNVPQEWNSGNRYFRYGFAN